jgi:hypothetical protein
MEEMGTEFDVMCRDKRDMWFWSSWCTICRFQAEMVEGQLSSLTEEDESVSLSFLNSWCIIVLEKVAKSLWCMSPPLPWDFLPCLLSLWQICYWSLRPPSIPWGQVPTLHTKEMPLLPKIILCTWVRTSLRKHHFFMWYTFPQKNYLNWPWFRWKSLHWRSFWRIFIPNLNFARDFIQHGKFSWPFISLGDT